MIFHFGNSEAILIQNWLDYPTWLLSFHGLNDSGGPRKAQDWGFIALKKDCRKVILIKEKGVMQPLSSIPYENGTSPSGLGINYNALTIIIIISLYAWESGWKPHLVGVEWLMKSKVQRLASSAKGGLTKIFVDHGKIFYQLMRYSRHCGAVHSYEKSWFRV